MSEQVSIRSSSMRCLRSTLAILMLTVMSSLVTPVRSFVPAASLSSHKQRQSTIHSSSRSNNNQEQSLYDILGASPTDSHDALRLRYTEMAKQTHPDAISSQLVTQQGSPAAQFSDVAAAWQILSDPKERLRYDRQLRAKEFTSTVESLLDVSMKTAIPFLRKTASTTVAAAEVTGKNMHDMGTRMGKAKTIFEMENRKRDLEQQATREKKKAKQLQIQLERLPSTKLDVLTNPSAELNSVKAVRVLDGFAVKDKRVAKREIESLKQMERDYGNKEKQAVSMESLVQTAQNRVEDALAAEQAALQRLEQAKKDVEQAKRDIDASRKNTQDATQRKTTALAALSKTAAQLDQRTEKVRTALRRTEEESLDQKARLLKKECGELYVHSEELVSRARDIAAQVAQRKREEAARR